MAEKTVKVKQPQTQPQKPRFEMSKLFQRARTTADKDHDREKPAQQPNAISKWYRETIGELRKVAWPTTHDAWRLTRIVLIVMTVMAAVLWFFDFLFSYIITLLVA